MTKDIRFEDDTFTNLEWSSPSHPRLRNLEELSYRDHGVTRLDFVFNDTVLFVKVEIPLADIVCRSPRRNKHHDFVVPLFTLFFRPGFVHLFRVIGDDALRKICTVGIVMISIRKSRTITRNGFLPPVRLIVPNGIGVAIIVPYTRRRSPSPVCKLTFGATQW
jgi:hypothetical protein